MKKIVTLLLIFISLNTFSQQGEPMRGKNKEKKEQIKALKVAFITNELQLTSEEAQKFWPLFNAFEEKQREIKKSKIKNYLSKPEDLSEKDATNLLNQMEAAEDELYQAKKKFIASLKGVLPATKILKLKKAEDDFSRKLLQQYRDKR